MMPLFPRRLSLPFALLVLLSCGCERQSPAELLLDDAAAIQRGEMIYTGTCGGYCHNNASRATEAPNLFDCNWLHGGSDEQIFHTIFNGVKGTRMIGFGGKLPEGDNDIWKLVAYLKYKRNC
jgi:mono/diheme cytochrome c family protein